MADKLPSPRRGEVWWVAFDPAIGGEIRKTRPAVVVSNDVANAAFNRVQVIPITSNVTRLYPAEAYVTLLGARRKALADPIVTAGKQRFGARLGQLIAFDLTAVERALRVQLGL